MYLFPLIRDDPAQYLFLQNGSEFFINDVAFVPPSVPALLQVLSGTVAAADLLPSGSYYSLPSNSSIEISFSMDTTDAPGAPHPFHLHGVSVLIASTCSSFSPRIELTAHVLRRPFCG